MASFASYGGACFPTIFAALVFAPTLTLAATAPDCEMIKIVEPYPPGGGTNVVARMVAEHITNTTGKGSYVENRPGASGNIGTAYAARATPDGCTIIIGTDATHAGNYYLFDNFPYHPINDFVPLAKAGTNLIALVAHPSIDAPNLQGLIEKVRENPSDMFYGSSGIGSPQHLAGELLNSLAGIKMTHVPYAGGAPAIANLLGGQIPLLFSSLSSSEPYIRSGQVKAYGITSADRFGGLPDVPAIGETVPGFEINSWLAFFGPAGMAPEHVAYFNETIRTALNAEKNKANLERMGLLVADDPPEVFAKQQKADFESRGELIRANNIQMEH